MAGFGDSVGFGLIDAEDIAATEDALLGWGPYRGWWAAFPSIVQTPGWGQTCHELGTGERTEGSSGISLQFLSWDDWQQGEEVAL